MYLNIQTQDLIKSYKKYQNFCSRLYKKGRKKYSIQQSLKSMNDNRQFSKTVEHFLSDEGSQCSQINLVDQDNTILYDKILSKEFSNLFDTAVKNLYVKGPQVSHVKENSDLIDIALNMTIILVYLKCITETMEKQIIGHINQYLFPCYVGTEKSSLHKRLCFILLKNGTLCLMQKNTQVLS